MRDLAPPAMDTGEDGAIIRLEIGTACLMLIEEGARRARPLEYCAALLGRAAAGRILVSDVLRLRNSDTRPGRFSIADAELDRAGTVAHELEVELVAVLHSHATGPPLPSHTDLRALALSRYPWVIAGFDPDDALRLAAFEAHTGARLGIACAGGQAAIGDSASSVSPHQARVR